MELWNSGPLKSRSYIVPKNRQLKGQKDNETAFSALTYGIDSHDRPFNLHNEFMS